MEAAHSVASVWSTRTGRPRPAVLRKDFVVDAYQLLEARAYGADTALLIVSLLPTVPVLQLLIDAARAIGMEPLVEVNSVPEMVVAAAAGARVIGVNNRNLRTFVVDMSTTPAVVAHVALEWARAIAKHERASKATGEEEAGPPPVPAAVLSLSGLRAPGDGAELVNECEASVSTSWHATLAAAAASGSFSASAAVTAPADASRKVLRGLLIGEALMRSPTPAALVAEFVAAVNVQHACEAAAAAVSSPALMAKICGVKQASSALQAARSGCHLLGMILVPGSPRFAGPTTAAAGITNALRAYREQDPGAELALLVVAAQQAARAYSSSSSAADPSPAEAAAALRGLNARAALLRRAVSRARPLSVGVFLDQPWGDVQAAAAAAGVDLVQLHGAEDPAAVAEALQGPFRWPVIKVLHVPAAAAADDCSALDAVVARLAAQCIQWARAGASALLLDTTAATAPSSSSSSRAGGTGARFPHQPVLSRLRARLEALCSPVPAPAAPEGAAEAEAAAVIRVPLLVAGGLTADTVADAAAQCAAAGRCPPGAGVGVQLALLGLDVSSGVERPPGQAFVGEDGTPAVAGKGSKDPLLVEAFVHAVATAARGTM